MWVFIYALQQFNVTYRIRFQKIMLEKERVGSKVDQACQVIEKKNTKNPIFGKFYLFDDTLLS